jgi:hypothetical protein
MDPFMMIGPTYSFPRSIQGCLVILFESNRSYTTLPICTSDHNLSAFNCPHFYTHPKLAKSKSAQYHAYPTIVWYVQCYKPCLGCNLKEKISWQNSPECFDNLWKSKQRVKKSQKTSLPKNSNTQKDTPDIVKELETHKEMKRWGCA